VQITEKLYPRLGLRVAAWIVLLAQLATLGSPAAWAGDQPHACLPHHDCYPSRRNGVEGRGDLHASERELFMSSAVPIRERSRNLKKQLTAALINSPKASTGKNHREK